MSKVIITSNRLPVTLQTIGGELRHSPSLGGLATGLAELMTMEEVLWVGWHGHAGRQDAPKLDRLMNQLREERMYPVHLSQQELQGYYKDVANGAIWPLYHYQAERMPLELSGWSDYVSVNARFADEIAALYRPDDVVWIHDYHLQLLPAMLRDILPNARIGFFLHTPFPSSEVFRILPWRTEILRGLLGADVIGFHTHAYARHFCSSLLRILGVESQGDVVQADGRAIKIGAFPLGVNASNRSGAKLAAHSELVESLQRMRREGSGQHVMLAIDRLDYTKGIPGRLLAVERLLEKHAHLRGTLVLVQVAAPSRDDVAAYGKYRRQVEGLVGRINGRFGMPGYQPIHYISRAFSQEDVGELYRNVDTMVVTPLRDGMNLVAKEFIASRVDLDGVLLLSEFAGAAVELGEAIMVNPYDVEDTAMGMLAAIEMSKEERRARMKALRNRVSQFDASAWARKFVEFLQGDPEVSHQVPFDKSTDLAESLPKVDKTILFLDYDGTLFPIVRIPQLAAPDRPLLALLEQLAKNPRFEIHIISGRAHAVMDTWFAGTNLHLHAEHGALSLIPGTTEWLPAITHPPADDWRTSVRALLDDFARNTPGSFVEEKTYGLAWHYRMSDPQHGERMANELRLHGRETFAPLGLEMITGKCVVEVRHIGVSKGKVVERVLAAASKECHAIAIGDDVTDEEMFAAVPASGTTIVVGDRSSQARHRLRDPAGVRRLLEILARPEGNK